jgi:hypothetical protein
VLIDAYGPGNSRSTSGDESRIIRMGYGADEIYTRSALRSLQIWKEFSAEQDETIFHQTGVLWLAHEDDPYATETEQTLARVGIPFVELTPGELAERYPQIGIEGIGWAMLEQESGVLSARRAVQSVAHAAIRNGTEYLLDAMDVSSTRVPLAGSKSDARDARNDHHEAGPANFGRGLCLRLRTLAAKIVSQSPGTAYPTHPSGSFLFRRTGRRLALHAAFAADMDRFQGRSVWIAGHRRSWSKGGSRSDTASPSILTQVIAWSRVQDWPRPGVVWRDVYRP